MGYYEGIELEIGYNKVRHHHGSQEKCFCIRHPVLQWFKRRGSLCIHGYATFSTTVYSVYTVTISHRVFITVYNGIPSLSTSTILYACIIIVGVSISRLLGERFGGNLRFGVGFSRLTFECFYAIIETSFTA